MPTVRLNRVTGVNAPGNGQPLRVGTGLIQSITHTPEARKRENDCEEEEGSMLDWSVGRVNATRFALYSKLSNLTSKEKEREREASLSFISFAQIFAARATDFISGRNVWYTAGYLPRNR